MLNKPKVTVYITNYNYGKFIKQAIESVINQTLNDFELIIIDDGSTDNSLEVIGEYLSYENIQLVQQKNKGLNVSNNVALRLARGSYIIRLDADDYFKPNALEVLCDLLDKDEEVGLVFPDYEEVDAEGYLIRKVVRHNFDGEVSLHDQPAHGACTMVRVSYLREVGGYDESFSCQDGYDLWIKIISQYKVSNTSEVLFCYRQHGTNLTRNEHRLLSTRSEMKKKFMERMNQSPPKCSVIIPIRSLNISQIPLINIDNQMIIKRLIKTALKSEIAEEVIVATSDQEIIDIVESSSSEKVKVLTRPKELSQYNASLMETLKLAVESDKTLLTNDSSVVVLSVQNPLIHPRYIDASIRTSVIFGADSVISVRRDNKSHYRHDGRSLYSIDNTSLTKYERDDLYVVSGGLTYVRLSKAFEQNSFPCGVISHVLVDEITAFEISTEFDLELSQYIAKNYKDSNNISRAIR